MKQQPTSHSLYSELGFECSGFASKHISEQVAEQTTLAVVLIPGCALTQFGVEGALLQVHRVCIVSVQIAFQESCRQVGRHTLRKTALQKSFRALEPPDLGFISAIS